MNDLFPGSQARVFLFRFLKRQLNRIESIVGFPENSVKQKSRLINAEAAFVCEFWKAYSQVPL